MDKLILSGRVLFAVSMIGLGLEHFIFGEFVTGRAPEWPSDLPGGQAFAYLSGGIVVLAGLAMLTGRQARIASILLSAMILCWALLRHIPVVAASEILSGDWTNAVKALAFTGGALAMAATFPRVEGIRNAALSKVVNYEVEFIAVATICLAVFMVNNGIQHFIFIDFVASLIPAWFPGDAVFWSYFSAVALFAGALGMLFRPTAFPAALLTGVMVFLWVWIVHVPRTFVSTSDNIAIFEAPAIAGIAFLIAGYRGKQAMHSGAAYFRRVLGHGRATS